MKSLLNKPFLSMTDYTPEEFAYYLDLAAALKKDKKEGKEIQTLKGKTFSKDGGHFYLKSCLRVLI